jgi:hypothetical protein
MVTYGLILLWREYDNIWTDTADLFLIDTSGGW